MKSELGVAAKIFPRIGDCTNLIGLIPLTYSLKLKVQA